MILGPTDYFPLFNSIAHDRNHAQQNVRKGMEWEWNMNRKRKLTIRMKNISLMARFLSRFTAGTTFAALQVLLSFTGLTTTQTYGSDAELVHDGNINITMLQHSLRREREVRKMTGSTTVTAVNQLLRHRRNRRGNSSFLG